MAKIWNWLELFMVSNDYEIAVVILAVIFSLDMGKRLWYRYKINRRIRQRISAKRWLMK